MDIPSEFSSFFQRALEIKKIALSMKNPLVVHHHDTDGITSGAIVKTALRKKGIPHRMKVVKTLDEKAVEELRKEKEIIFVDLGAGNKMVNELEDVVIIDHHQTKGIEKPQLNPLLFGIDGGRELSSSGAAYVTFKERIDLAVVGAVGDMQFPFKGLNKLLLEKAEKEGKIKVERDLLLYGRYSRPLLQFIVFSDDPYIPSLSFNEDNVVLLFKEIGVETEKEGRPRTYSELSSSEKRKLVSALVEVLMAKGKERLAKRLVGETYLLIPSEIIKYPMDASEFSTMLNACGRHGKADVGVGFCLGEKGAKERAEELLLYHKKMIRNGIQYARASLNDFGPFYFLDGRGNIDEGIIGIVCGMLGGLGKPVFGIADSEDGRIKISGRGTVGLVEDGLNLGGVLKGCTEKCGGIGGGHQIAAGATFPKENLNEFLICLEKVRQ